MFLKNKIVKSVLYGALSLVLLYTGISCGAALCKAGSLPHIAEKGVKHTFLGYYIIAAAYGVIFLAALALLILLIVKAEKSKD